MILRVEGVIDFVYPESEKYYYILVKPRSGAVSYGAVIPKYPFLQHRVAENKQVSLFFYEYNTQKESYTVAITDTKRFKFFLRFIRVSGVGPKLSALVVEYFEDFDTLLEAIVTKDVATLAKIPGLGRKKASNILLHLLESREASDFIKSVTHQVSIEEQKESSIWENTLINELVGALVGLGLSVREAREKIKEKLADLEPYLQEESNTDIAELLRIVLGSFASRQ